MSMILLPALGTLFLLLVALFGLDMRTFILSYFILFHPVLLMSLRSPILS